MATARNYSNTASQAQLSAAIAATDTSITLAGFTGYPAAPFTAAIARGTANEEIVLVTAVSANTVTVTRGYDSTTAKAQGAGSTLQEVAAAIDFREANAHVVATTGVHGVTGAVVGTTDVQTLTNKTLTAPTISGPTQTGTSTIATASITTLTVTGASTLAGLSATTGSFSSTLAVTGVSTLTGALNANGGISATTITTTGLVTAASASVTGTTTLTGTVTAGADINATNGNLHGKTLQTDGSILLGQLASTPGVPAAGQLKAYAKSTGAVYLEDSTASSERRLIVHWGSAATFPSNTAVNLGDTCARSDLGNTLWTWNGTSWITSDVVLGKLMGTGTAAYPALTYNAFTTIPFTTTAARLLGGVTAPVANRLQLPIDGLWEITGRAYLTGTGIGQAAYTVWRTRASTADALLTGTDMVYKQSTRDQAGIPIATSTVPLKAGDQLFIQAYLYDNVTMTSYTLNEANGCTLQARWVGPLNGATPL